MNGKGSVQKPSFLKKFSFLIVFSFVFASTFILSSSSALACKKPGIMNEKQTTINTAEVYGIPHGRIIVNGTKDEYVEANYTEVNATIFVHNRDDEQVVSVMLRPYKGLRDYVGDVYVPNLQPGETREVSLRTWIYGQSYYGAVEVYWTCPDGITTLPTPYFLVYIIGREISPPPSSTCESRDLDACWAGMSRDYYCDANRTLVYTEACTNYCCEKYGGEGSACSSDGQTCYTPDSLPLGTEGNIALICDDKSCASDNERLLKFMFGINGWNVTMRPKELWTDWELNTYDIIACAGSRACSMDFNSLIYNQHTDERKPFLEIPNSRGLSAAYTFGYTTSKSTSSAKSDPVVDSVDNITEGYSGSVQVVRKADSYLTIKDSYLAASAKDLAYSGDASSSVMFKVKEAVDHGRYAFIGWVYDSTSLTKDGGVLLNRTLKWLKEGDAAFGGENYELARKGGIAFICSKDDCKQDYEMDLIKYLRKEGYSVAGKEAGKWIVPELRAYDLIVCSDSKTCEIKFGSAIYSAHKDYGTAFLEIPNNGGVAAAYAFGYVHSKSYKKPSYAIIPRGVGNDAIFSGFNGYMEIFSDDEDSMTGPNSKDLNPATNLAIIPNSEDKYGNSVSAMFVSNAAGSKGRYAYVGWVPDLELLNENGKKLLLRTIDWLMCGDGCLQSFSDEFGDLSLKFELHSPAARDYSDTSIYINLTANQRLKEISYSINGSKDKKLCTECSGVYKRIRTNEGQNELKIKLVDYLGNIREKTVSFFVDSKTPRISSVSPTGKYVTATQKFEIKYSEDYLKRITLFYGTGVSLQPKELQGCLSGSYRICSVQVYLSQFVGQQIKYYFVIEDKTHQVISKTYYASVVG